MDNNLDITGLRTAAQTAGNDVTSLISQAPGMLGDLRKSLVSIYAKDNPIIAARDTALSDYLSAGDKARAEFLPKNQPMIAGSPLNYSPTELNAIVSGRQAAALAPLLGLNQAVSQGYGNIGDILNAANTAYGYQVKAAENKAINAYNIYKAAIDEYEAITKRQNANLGANFFSGFGGYRGGQTTGGGSDWEIVNTPTQNPNIEIPGQGVIQPYSPIPITSTPYSGPTFNATPNNLSTNGQSLNFLGLGQNYGPFRQ